MLSIKKFVSKLSTENRDGLSLPTKEGFFQKLPAEHRKRLGATHIWNKAFLAPRAHFFVNVWKSAKLQKHAT